MACAAGHSLVCTIRTRGRLEALPKIRESASTAANQLRCLRGKVPGAASGRRDKCTLYRCPLVSALTRRRPLHGHERSNLTRHRSNPYRGAALLSRQGALCAMRGAEGAVANELCEPSRGEKGCSERPGCEASYTKADLLSCFKRTRVRSETLPSSTTEHRRSRRSAPTSPFRRLLYRYGHYITTYCMKWHAPFLERSSSPRQEDV